MDDNIRGHGCTLILSFIQVNWTFGSLISHSSQPFHQHVSIRWNCGGVVWAQLDVLVKKELKYCLDQC